jgi:hypothetical protein
MYNNKQILRIIILCASAMILGFFIQKAAAQRGHTLINTPYIDTAAIDIPVFLPSYTIGTTKACTKISTDYPMVYDIVTTKYADSLKYVTIQYRRDHGGAYKHFIIYLPLGMNGEITEFLKSPINQKLIEQR